MMVQVIVIMVIIYSDDGGCSGGVGDKIENYFLGGESPLYDCFFNFTDRQTKDKMLTLNWSHFYTTEEKLDIQGIIFQTKGTRIAL